MDAIRIEHLEVRFGATRILRDLCLSVGAGKVTCLVGETGSGKSVLLSSILGILPRAAEEDGAVFVQGTDVKKLRPAELRKLRGSLMAYIPQGSGNGLDPMLRMGTQMGEGARAHRKMSRRAAFRLGAELLERFDIRPGTSVAKKRPYMLSGGMRQRALIAMGLALDAPIVLADEPTKGLDRERVALVIDSFSRLEGKTILCVTHDLRFARAIADRICVLYSGEIVEDRAAEDFFASPLHPYSQALLSALPENGLQVAEGFARPHAELPGDVCAFYDRCARRGERCLRHPELLRTEEGAVRCVRYGAESH
ncbi:MAG: ABC transporter ATP-binding protein [Oscillospiraceae bacterium]|nr:ABC transporter ATP-binding protein [Oscillospiraceae bacterium]